MPRILTEDQIEARVERMIDHLDRVYLAGEISRKDYDLACIDLNTWTDAEYRKRDEARLVELGRAGANADTRHPQRAEWQRLRARLAS